MLAAACSALASTFQRLPNCPARTQARQRGHSEAGSSSWKDFCSRPGSSAQAQTNSLMWYAMLKTSTVWLYVSVVIVYQSRTSKQVQASYPTGAERGRFSQLPLQSDAADQLPAVLAKPGHATVSLRNQSECCAVSEQKQHVFVKESVVTAPMHAGVAPKSATIYTYKVIPW